MLGELIPMVMFVVIGFITLGYFHFNSKNRQAILATVLFLGWLLNDEMING